MPPDRDVQFVIELKPGTTPIYKTPFRMTTPELTELKEHIRELLEKVYTTLLFFPATQTCCSEGEDGLEFFDEEF
jgi:hypothetical protein